MHFKQRVATSKLTCIERERGFDSSNDQPVEVIFVPRRMSDFSALNAQLLTFNAHKELIASPHFPSFLGNSLADHNCFLYFSELTEGVNLREFIEQGSIELEEDTPLFKYWASLSFQTFRDIFSKCSYTVQLPLGL